jgi:hypothetical protein
MSLRALTFRRSRRAAVSMMVAWLSAFVQLAAGAAVVERADLSIGAHVPAISAPAIRHVGASETAGQSRADRDTPPSLFHGADGIMLLVAHHGDRARAETSVPARPIDSCVVTYDATAPPGISNS